MVENEKPLEREKLNSSRSETYVARIFLQTKEALNPDHKLTDFSVDDLVFGDEKADLLNRASVYTATDYWRKKDGGNLSYDQQMQVFRSKWARAGRDRYRSLLKDGSSGEFKDDHAKREVEYLAKIGIDIRNFDEKAVQEFYDKYLDNGRDLMGFIDTVFYADGVEDEVMEHIEAIKFLAGMFDRETAIDLEGIISLSGKYSLDMFRQKALRNPEVTSQTEKDRLRFLSHLMQSKTGRVEEVIDIPAGNDADAEQVITDVSHPLPAGKDKDTGKSLSGGGKPKTNEVKDAVKIVIDDHGRERAGRETKPVGKPTVVPAETTTMAKVTDDSGKDDNAEPVPSIKKDEIKPASAPKPPVDVKKKLEPQVAAPTEARKPAESVRDGYRLATAEDLERIEKKIIDREHVHVHPQAFVIPDTHSLGAEAIVERVREMAGKGADVRYNPADSRVTINGQEAHIYGLGDMFDLSKDLTVLSFRSKNAFETALNDESHFFHDKAVKLKQNFDENPQLRNNFEARWDSFSDYDTRSNYEFWKKRIENGEVILGNHDLELLCAMYETGSSMIFHWLDGTNGGLEAYSTITGNSPHEIARGLLREKGIQETDLVRFQLQKTKYVVNGKTVDFSDEIANALRNEFNKSEIGIDMLNNLRMNFKLYNVVNGALLVHAGIPIDEDGNLIKPETGNFTQDRYPKEARDEFYGRLENKTGLELYDEIEKMVKEGGEAGRFAIVYLARGSGSNASPVWMRDTVLEQNIFQSRIEKYGNKVLGQLNKQMKAKGGPQITRIIIGHDPHDQGQMWGTRLLGADDKRGSAVRLDVQSAVVKDDPTRLNFRVEIDAPHHFGQKDGKPLQSNLVQV